MGAYSKEGAQSRAGGGGAFSFKQVENGLVVPRHLPRTKIKRRNNVHKGTLQRFRVGGFFD